ncbi:MAG: pyridoxal 5'-phosphate synthase glutaminase subunit PdxT [Thaumarchaeota archaeon]|jgi:5'-phosphate synthase pdxT subunit|nr:pyridoxal 5'-phosphate synthase glutaminase subunit PdxT [Nitrososphaerota archaeon]MCL7386331.1 pyridoxal 5'-phosphate synthase glutaminase subunit PdxT [Candidatus Wolframiiraptor allenii]
MRIGVIGVQGAVTEHIEALHRTLAKIGVHGDVMWVRRLDQLRGVSALVIPGGESTTISKLMCWNGLFNEVKRLGEEGLPIMGTCAGLIILAKKVLGATIGQSFLELLDVEVQRNAYGRQVNSFEAPITLSFSPDPFPGIFIRAPRILKVHGRARPIAFYKEEVVGVEQDNLLGLTFHPELSNDTRIHEYFIEKVR